MIYLLSHYFYIKLNYKKIALHEIKINVHLLNKTNFNGKYICIKL